MSDDCISRQAILDVLQELWGSSGELMDRIMELPSVTSKPKTGKWINEKWDGIVLLGVTCSCCGVVEGRFTSYCPNCGAKMEVSE